MDGSGFRVHALVAESAVPDATALLLLHGWPSTGAEHWEVVEPLRRRHHVVVASLPGFGFSGPTTRGGVGPARIADGLVELMGALGFPRFFVAGGDWGAIVGSWLAARAPEHTIGLHTTLLACRPDAEARARLAVTPEEADHLERSARVITTGSAYQAVQGTKPQSLAYGLTDSPAGLAGWIVEKFHDWSDRPEALPAERLLDTLSVYWFTGTINSSMRLYHEAQQAGEVTPPGRVGVPTGHAAFPGEPFSIPRSWAEESFEIVRWQRMPRGGHFPAMEVPDLYATELLAFTEQVGSTSGLSLDDDVGTR